MVWIEFQPLQKGFLLNKGLITDNPPPAQPTKSVLYVQINIQLNAQQQEQQKTQLNMAR